jgi:hypothetical protein
MLLLPDLILVVNSEELKSKLNIGIEMIRLLLVNPKQRLAGYSELRQTNGSSWLAPPLAGWVSWQNENN